MISGIMKAYLLIKFNNFQAILRKYPKIFHSTLALQDLTYLNDDFKTAFEFALGVVFLIG